MREYNLRGESWCPICESYKPFDEFGSAPARGNGCQGYCKRCAVAEVTRRKTL